MSSEDEVEEARKILNSFTLIQEVGTMSNNSAQPLYFSATVSRMMQNMSYKEGSGLGKNEQGIKDSIDFTFQHGKKGLGNRLKQFGEIIAAATTDQSWDFTQEKISVKEDITWIALEGEDVAEFTCSDMKTWIKEGARNMEVASKSEFCDSDLYQKVLKAKEIFDQMDHVELSLARARSNPFETIKNAFFMNRAALKMANIDAATNFMFSKIDESEYFRDDPGPYYFADVCAGPGGFTEYMLWRRQWHFKGFGLTYKHENDFNLTNSCCDLPVTFQQLYGEDGDGNVCSPKNISDFRDKVKHETGGQGVHFMMSDGGFSVDGNENLQEVLSKHIYLCQCLVALSILRPHGHFVTKVFDIFTPFSMGLLYLMYQCFEKVSILKPNTSRPANAERYYICCNYLDTEKVQRIKFYLWSVATILWDMVGTEKDISEIVPLKLLREDHQFYNYIIESNNRLAKKQIVALNKMGYFCKNHTSIDPRQEHMRKACLKYWNIPDEARQQLPVSIPGDFLAVTDRTEYLLVEPREMEDIEQLKITISDLDDWHYYPMFGYDSSECHVYAGTGYSKVYRIQGCKWTRVKDLELCRGTILYGELINELVQLSEDNRTHTRLSLQVIDALRLGTRSLRNLPFLERQKLLEIYCKSVNKESEESGGSRIRIRLKPKHLLSNIINCPLIKEEPNQQYSTKLEVLGYNTKSEWFQVKSLLLLKTNREQSFFTTYVLRVQIPIKGKKYLPFKDIIKVVESMLEEL